MSDITSIQATVEEVGDKISERLDFGDESVSDTEALLSQLGIEEETSPDKTACHLAAFNELLKLALYEEYRAEGAPLKNISLASRAEFYEEAYEKTRNMAFRGHLLDSLVKDIDPDILDPLWSTQKQLRSDDSPTETIGGLFENIVSQETRRERGQFHTPKFVADLMARWSIRSGDDTVLDPGFGAGVLTASALDTKDAAQGEERVDEIWGVDISTLAPVMAGTGLKIQNGSGAPHFKVGDYMETLSEGSNTRLDNQDPIQLPKFDAIISNPPYSRSASLEADRGKFNKIAEQNGLSVSGFTPLYVYFFAHSEQFLADNGRMAFITPSQFFDTNYGEKLRQFLLDRFNIRAMLFLESDINVFNARVTPCITLFEKSRKDGLDETRFLRIDNWSDTDELLSFIERETVEDGETPFGYVHTVSQKELLAERDWRNYVDPKAVDSIPALTAFEEIADIKRGIATGMNDYFCLTQQEVDEWGLSEEHLSKLIRRTGGMEMLRVNETIWQSWRDNGKEVWLLYCYDEEGNRMESVDGENLESFLKYGEKVGADSSYLAENRTKWYAVDRREPPDILATYMSQDGFRFIKNEADIRTLNNLHNINLESYDDRQVDALLAYLNSDVANEITKHSSRTYADGLHKIEPSELKNIPVLDPNNLSDGEIDLLSRKFTELCDSIRSSDSDETDKQSELDKCVREILQIP